MAKLKQDCEECQKHQDAWVHTHCPEHRGQETEEVYVIVNSQFFNQWYLIPMGEYKDFRQWDSRIGATEVNRFDAWIIDEPEQVLILKHRIKT